MKLIEQKLKKTNGVDNMENVNNSNDKQKSKENKMQGITDRELLAMCNLSNLKLEFANLKTKDAFGNYIDHTIYQILEKEFSYQKAKKKNIEKIPAAAFIYDYGEKLNVYDSDVHIEGDANFITQCYRSLKNGYTQYNFLTISLNKLNKTSLSPSVTSPKV